MAAVSDQITLKFGWKEIGSRVDVRTVDLIFENQKRGITVHIPRNLPPFVIQECLFSCREIEMPQKRPSFKSIVREETGTDSLQVTSEQIKKLIIKAHFFKEASVGLVDREVQLNMPEKLEVGQTYRLVLVSKDLSLEASFLKEEVFLASEPKIDSQLASDQAELMQYLRPMLSPLLNLKIAEFKYDLKAVLSDANRGAAPDISNENLGIEEIQKEIGKIRGEILQELLTKIKYTQSVWEKSSLMEQRKMGKETFRLCFTVIGEEGMINIMRGCLESFVPGDRSPKVRSLIEAVSIEFKERCKEYTK